MKDLRRCGASRCLQGFPCYLELQILQENGGEERVVLINRANSGRPHLGEAYMRELYSVIERLDGQLRVGCGVSGGSVGAGREQSRQR